MDANTGTHRRTGAGFALQPIDEVDDGVEAAPGAAADAGPRNSYRQMRLAGAGSTDQHGIALFGQKGAARQIADQHLIDWRAGEVEVPDVLGQRQLGNGQLVLDRARLLFGDLGAEQIADDPLTTPTEYARPTAELLSPVVQLCHGGAGLPDQLS